MGYHYPDDDAPVCVILGDRKQRARKEHRCDTCPLDGPRELAVIPVGQEYRRITGTQDGYFFVHRECVGGCPHAENCPDCNGTGLAKSGDPFGDCCGSCFGVGQLRSRRVEA